MDKYERHFEINQDILRMRILHPADDFMKKLYNKIWNSAQIFDPEAEYPRIGYLTMDLDAYHEYICLKPFDYTAFVGMRIKHVLFDHRPHCHPGQAVVGINFDKTLTVLEIRD